MKPIPNLALFAVSATIALAQETARIEEPDPLSKGPKDTTLDQSSMPTAGDQSKPTVETIKFRDGTIIRIKNALLPQIDYAKIKFSLDLSKLTLEEAQGIEDKRAIKYFDHPVAIWRIDDGFLGSYDGGEFGGALFHFSSDGNRRALIVGEHVSDVIQISKDEFIIAGGEEIGDLGMGIVIKIVRDKNSKWKAETLARFFDGIAGITGRTDRNTFLVSTWRTIAAGFLTPPDKPGHETRVSTGAYFEMKPDGWMRYLGESIFPSPVEHPKAENDGSQQGVSPNDR